jgi:hypothetical protein
MTENLPRYLDPYEDLTASEYPGTNVTSANPIRFISLTDQQPLTESEQERALRMADLCQNLMKHREKRIEELGLDPTIWCPAANWGAPELSPVYAAAHSLMRGESLGYLRLLAQHFTGYALWALKDGYSTSPPTDPGALNEALLERSSNPDLWAIGRCAQIRSQIPAYLHISPPPKFGEVGWVADDLLVNYDAAAYLERVEVLYRAGLLDRGAVNCLRPGSRILEIGAGYGALAWYIQEAAPGTQYTALDLPESLVYSAVYLEVLHPGATRFLPNYEFPELVQSGERFDLVINTLSMSEMSEPQVRAYCDGIRSLIGDWGYFFEQNQDNRHAGLLNAQDIVQEYFSSRQMLGAPRTARHLDQGWANLWTNQA